MAVYCSPDHQREHWAEHCWTCGTTGGLGTWGEGGGKGGHQQAVGTGALKGAAAAHGAVRVEQQTSAAATTASPATEDAVVKPVHKKVRSTSISTSASTSRFRMPLKRPQSKLADDEGLVYSKDLIKRMALADDTLCYVPDDAALVLISKSTEAVMKHFLELAYCALPDNRVRVEDLADVAFGARGGGSSEREAARLRCLQPLMRPFLSEASSFRQAAKITAAATGDSEPTPATHATPAPEEYVPDPTLHVGPGLPEEGMP